MDFSGSGYTFMVIIGPILLAAVILWALLRNRATRGQDAQADRGARDLYAREERRSKD